MLNEWSELRLEIYSRADTKENTENEMRVGAHLPHWLVINSSSERADMTVRWTIFETGLIFMVVSSSHILVRAVKPLHASWQQAWRLQHLDFSSMKRYHCRGRFTFVLLPIVKKICEINLIILIYCDLFVLRSIMWIKIPSEPKIQKDLAFSLQILQSVSLFVILLFKYVA